PGPVFTITGHPQCTEHGDAVILVNINCLIPSQWWLEQSCDFYQCPAEHWLKLVGGVFILP
ncbi:unnamed protein product, partial [Staurois parvus]